MHGKSVRAREYYTRGERGGEPGRERSRVTRARVQIYRALSSKGGGEPGNEATFLDYSRVHGHGDLAKFYLDIYIMHAEDVSC